MSNTRRINNLNSIHLRPTKPTPAELEVMLLIALGFTDKEIGSIIGKSHHTVRTQVTTLCTRLHVRSRSAALAVCFRNGWIT